MSHATLMLEPARLHLIFKPGVAGLQHPAHPGAPPREGSTETSVCCMSPGHRRKGSRNVAPNDCKTGTGP